MTAKGIQVLLFPPDDDTVILRDDRCIVSRGRITFGPKAMLGRYVSVYLSFSTIEALARLAGEPDGIIDVEVEDIEDILVAAGLASEEVPPRLAFLAEAVEDEEVDGPSS